MNGKKARTLRRLFGVKHVRQIPASDRWMFEHIVRERRDANTWGFFGPRT